MNRAASITRESETDYDMHLSGLERVCAPCMEVGSLQIALKKCEYFAQQKPHRVLMSADESRARM
jgi:hypothetical protein